MINRVFSRRSLLALISGVAVIILLWFAWRTTDWQGLVSVLGQLEPLEIGYLLVLNAGIFVLMSARWWWILRTMGYPVSIFSLARYRLTAFGINYFTPGPQFGGEPYQVYVLYKEQSLPIEVGASAVAFDKLIELLANFGFLTVGFWTLLRFGFLPGTPGLLFFALPILVILPLGLYFFALWKKKLPAVYLITHFLEGAEKSPFWARVFRTGMAAERQAAQALQEHPGLFFISLFLSAISWVALVFEYHLALEFLGLSLALPETIGVLTAARIAFLFPFPGGLGSLEVSQVFAMQALGAGPAIGISMSLLIRARDVLFGGVGLLLGGYPLRRKTSLMDRPQAHQESIERNRHQKTSVEPGTLIQ